MLEKKIGFISLGCPKALVDSERIITQLRSDGYSISPTYKEADMVIVNTCGFINSAKEESLQAIGEAINENGKVIVTGCLGKQRDLITKAHPKVLGITGPQAYQEVVTQVREFLPPPITEYDPHTDLIPPQGIKLTPQHYAYLKISEGCNHQCTFCIIPSMRGNLKSRPIGDVLDEAERLVNAGVKELLVISQDTSAYGIDNHYQTGFWQGKPIKNNLLGLCKTLGELDIWIRLHYVYPYPHVDNVIPLMAEGKILPYLDIPFQHASSKVLRAMRRPAATEKTLRRIKLWRQEIPDITIRSTFIVGFPGETEEDFEELLEFLGEAQLDRVGCFKYSPVDGAKANELPNHILEEVKEERWNRLMKKQQQISANRLSEKVGNEIFTIIDENTEEGFVGRSTADAPEIDGLVYIKSNKKLKSGDIISVRVDNSDEYDLFATF
ncbi:MAG: 30S ribosomal protein S12 methylthiotransferase RimO [Gammaproteobacteria bacterium]|nr:30S ribosomal protein S12 methylthiotransferase RimO [Gammaproteobacteria bacterium]